MLYKRADEEAEFGYEDETHEDCPATQKFGSLALIIGSGCKKALPWDSAAPHHSILKLFVAANTQRAASMYSNLFVPQLLHQKEEETIARVI